MPARAPRRRREGGPPRRAVLSLRRRRRFLRCHTRVGATCDLYASRARRAPGRTIARHGSDGDERRVSKEPDRVLREAPSGVGAGTARLSALEGSTPAVESPVLRIAIDARKMRDYGIGTYVRNLLRHLSRLDSETEYILFC